MKKCLLISILLLITASVSLAQQCPKPIKIGAVLHLTGDLAMPCAAFREGLEVALEELREEPRFANLSLIVEDAQNNASKSISATRKLLSQDKVDAALLSSYIDAMSDGQLYEKAKVPAIVLWDANPEMENLGDYIFALGPWTPSSGAQPARFAKNKLAAQKAVVIVNQDPYSIGAANAFKEEFIKLGGSILQEIEILPGSDPRAEIAKVKLLNPDVAYVPLCYDIVPFFKRWDEIKIKAPIITCDTISEEHIKSVPRAFEGIYHTRVPPPPKDSEALQRMVARYTKRYGHAPGMEWFVGTAYDAMHLIARSISKGRCTGEEIAKGLYEDGAMPAASRPEIKINAKGSAAQDEIIYQIKNSKPSPYWP